MIKKLSSEILIIGAGISGCTLAENYATKGKRVVIIEKRNHIGGNCFDYTNNIGLRINKYGPHYFRTNDEEVWKYVQKFSEWSTFEPEVISHVDGKKVPLPVNINTINTLFGLKLKNGEEMKKFIRTETSKIKNPANFEENALKIVGKNLYEKIYKNYTLKQWGIEPKKLSPGIMSRVGVWFDRDNRLLREKYQAYPTRGYTKMFEKMLASPNIKVRLNTSWGDIKDSAGQYEKIFFTGRIEQFFDYKFGRPQYRSLRFEEKNLNQEWFQEYVQENYPDLKVPFTRIVEYKHQTGQINSKTTMIVKEYPTWKGEPYYPVLTEENLRIYEKYRRLAEKLKKKNVFFVGRLANYKYFNMDEAFKNALNLFHELES